MFRSVANVATENEEMGARDFSFGVLLGEKKKLKMSKKKKKKERGQDRQIATRCCRDQSKRNSAIFERPYTRRNAAQVKRRGCARKLGGGIFPLQTQSKFPQRPLEGGAFYSSSSSTSLSSAASVPLSFLTCFSGNFARERETRNSLVVGKLVNGKFI